MVTYGLVWTGVSDEAWATILFVVCVGIDVFAGVSVVFRSLCKVVFYSVVCGSGFGLLREGVLVDWALYAASGVLFCVMGQCSG